MPFSRRIAGHFALVGVQLAHGAVHEQLRAFADVGERRLELMRHVSQEAVPLVREIEQALAQPFELAAEALQVVRARDGDLVGEGALAELADGTVELPQRPAHGDGQDEDRDDGQRHQQRRLPEQAPARAPVSAPRGPRPRRRSARCSAPRRCRRALLSCGEVRATGPRPLLASRYRRAWTCTAARMFCCSCPTSLQGLRALRCVACRCELLARAGQARILRAVQIEQLRVVQHVVEARGALERGDLTEQLLAGAGGRDALDHDLLTGVGQRADLQGGGQDGDQKRHGDQRQAEEHQSAQ